MAVRLGTVHLVIQIAGILIAEIRIGSRLEQGETRDTGKMAVQRIMVEEVGVVGTTGPGTVAQGTVAQGTVDDLAAMTVGTIERTVVVAVAAASAGAKGILGVTTGRSDHVARATISPLTRTNRLPRLHRRLRLDLRVNPAPELRPPSYSTSHSAKHTDRI